MHNYIMDRKQVKVMKIKKISIQSGCLFLNPDNRAGDNFT